MQNQYFFHQNYIPQYELLDIEERILPEFKQIVYMGENTDMMPACSIKNLRY